MRISMLVAVAFLTFICYCVPSDAADGTRSVADAAVIDGFRTAMFGMTEKEIRAAIARDFGGASPRVEANPVQRTRALIIVGKEVLPGAPPATVSYLLGMTSAKLIQINVVWGSEPGGAELPALTATGNVLRDYFLQKSYDQQSFTY